MTTSLPSTLRLVATAFVVCGILSGCASSTSTGDAGTTGATDGGVDAATGVSDDRVATCAAYASATAACCDQGTQACPRSGEGEWNSYCLGYAKTCSGMPTCFSTADCNTLIFCGGGC